MQRPIFVYHCIRHYRTRRQPSIHLIPTPRINYRYCPTFDEIIGTRIWQQLHLFNSFTSLYTLSSDEPLLRDRTIRQTSVAFCVRTFVLNLAYIVIFASNSLDECVYVAGEKQHYTVQNKTWEWLYPHGARCFSPEAYQVNLILKYSFLILTFGITQIS